jgi:hypothetical protein
MSVAWLHLRRQVEAGFFFSKAVDAVELAGKQHVALNRVNLQMTQSTITSARSAAESGCGIDVTSGST